MVWFGGDLGGHLVPNLCRDTFPLENLPPDLLKWISVEHVLDFFLLVKSSHGSFPVLASGKKT